MTDKPEESPSDDELREAIANVRDRPGELHDARILDAARRAAAEHRKTRARKTTRLAPGLAVAATMLVAVSLTFVWLQEDAIDSSAVRGGALNVAPLEGAELSGAPLEFSWPDEPARHCSASPATLNVNGPSSRRTTSPSTSTSHR